MIWVEAPGLRPVASAALKPTIPTPMADPSAARPTWMLPAISAIRGNHVMLLFFLLVFDFFPANVAVLPRSDCQIVLRIYLRFNLVCASVLLIMGFAHEKSEHSSEQHKDQSLY